MAGKAHQEATVYEEFEPFCKWQRNEDRDILEINLKDFKKEQLRVQISNHGMLKISGERQLVNSSTKEKFYKEIPVPNNAYDTQAIHAKLIAGWLYITMPKLNPVPKPSIGNTSASSEPSSKTLDDQTPKAELVKDESSKAAPPPKEQTPASGGKSPTGFELEGGKRSRASRPRLAKVAVSLAATAAAMAVLIAYVVYMFRSTVVGFEDY
ncbi:hypothetical protein CASFOL_030573 [Castilleja foliolosa]|uniref:SHSP domain-containing protein n=1 Tax=Castilleja foliolosa TaxID=1961234 RepID=A0ABD3C721_9LAMI